MNSILDQSINEMEEILKKIKSLERKRLRTDVIINKLRSCAHKN